MRSSALILAVLASAAGVGVLPSQAFGQDVAGPIGFDLRAEGGEAEVAVVAGDWTEAKLSELSWKVRLSTPIGGDATSSDFITDGGLRGSTALRASLNFVAHGSLTTTDRSALALRAVAACEAQAGSKEQADSCSGKGYGELAVYLSRDEAERLREPKVDVVLAGVSGGIGRQSLDLRDPLTLTERTETKTPYAISASIGGELGKLSLDHYIGFGVEHTREYRGPDERTLCGPPPTTGPQECFTGSFGDARAVETTAAFLIVRVQRHFPLLGRRVPFAVEVQPAHDFESEVSEVATTLFLLPDSDDRLRGGLRFRWRSADKDPTTDDDRFSFGVFVGVPFSLYAPEGHR